MKFLMTLVLLAAVAGAAWFTKPTEAAMKAESDAIFAAKREAQARDLDLGGLAKGAVLGLTRTAKFEDLTVASRYTVTEDDKEVLSCWGAFTKVMCSAKAE